MLHSGGGRWKELRVAPTALQAYGRVTDAARRCCSFRRSSCALSPGVTSYNRVAEPFISPREMPGKVLTFALLPQARRRREGLQVLARWSLLCFRHRR